MAIVGSSRHVNNPGYNDWVVQSDLDTETGNITLTVYGASGNALYQGTTAQVLGQINRRMSQVGEAEKPFWQTILDTANSVSASSNSTWAGIQAEKQKQEAAKQEAARKAAEEAKPPADTGSKKSASDDNQKPPPPRPNNTQSADEVFTRPNPLAKFSSYTYGLTLYMMTPECANAFAGTGKLPTSAGREKWVIVAQSASINNAKEPRGLTFTGDLGPGQSGLNFYMDDLSIQTYLLAQDKQRTATVATEFSFKVVEPIGFTFLTKLSNASKQLNNFSNLNSSSNNPMLYQQHYAVGVRFYGYDENGEVIKSKDVADSEQVAGDGYGIYERIFPVIIQKLNFRLTGRSTVYNFEAVMQNLQGSFGIKRGYINTQVTIEGSTVGEILGDTQANKKSLMNWLNNNQAELKDKKAIDKPATYSIEWVDNDIFKSTDIKNSSLTVDSEPNLKNSKTNDVSTTAQSNVKLTVQNKNVDTKTKVVTIPANSSIVTVIDQIISKSRYVSDKLLANISEKLESEMKPESPGKFDWFAVHPVVTIKDRDAVTQDWVYDIKYQVVPYMVPYAKNQFINSRSKYYGPVKRYNYILTGENTEVINFEMEFNNLYYIVNPTTTTKGQKVDKKNVGNTPVHATGQVNDNSGIMFSNKGGSLLESVRSNLYSPADMAIANMKILGDPDFLMTVIGASLTESLVSKFAAKNGSINPYGGQIFTEIVFKVAEDYNIETGLLDVDKNQTIGFYSDEEQSIIGNRGIIYRINKVVSTFARGKFEQDLEMFMVHPSELIIPNEKAASGASSGSRSSSGTTASAASVAFDKQDDSYDRKEVGSKTRVDAAGGGRGTDQFWQQYMSTRSSELQNSKDEQQQDEVPPAQNSGSKVILLEAGKNASVNSTNDDAQIDYYSTGLYGP